MASQAVTDIDGSAPLRESMQANVVILQFWMTDS